MPGATCSTPRSSISRRVASSAPATTTPSTCGNYAVDLASTLDAVAAEVGELHVRPRIPTASRDRDDVVDRRGQRVRHANVHRHRRPAQAAALAVTLGYLRQRVRLRRATPFDRPSAAALLLPVEAPPLLRLRGEPGSSPRPGDATAVLAARRTPALPPAARRVDATAPFTHPWGEAEAPRCARLGNSGFLAPAPKALTPVSWQGQAAGEEQRAATAAWGIGLALTHCDLPETRKARAGRLGPSFPPRSTAGACV